MSTYDTELAELNKEQADVQAALTGAKGDHARAALTARGPANKKLIEEVKSLAAEVANYQAQLDNLAAAKVALAEQHASDTHQAKVDALAQLQVVLGAAGDQRIKSAKAVDAALVSLRKALGDLGTASAASRHAVLQSVALRGANIEHVLASEAGHCLAPVLGALHAALEGTDVGRLVEYRGLTTVPGVVPSVVEATADAVDMLALLAERWQLGVPSVPAKYEPEEQRGAPPYRPPPVVEELAA